MAVAKLFLLTGVICASLLLGMYLNADGHAVSSVEKVAYASIMLALNAAGILFIESKQRHG